jgi:hypothetical protein
MKKPHTALGLARRQKGLWKEGCFISRSAVKMPEKARLSLSLLFRSAKLGWKAVC